jgi:hypothetical protein
MSCRLRAYIKSFTVAQKQYKISRDDELNEFTCNCPDYHYRPQNRPCKHLKAILNNEAHFFDRLILFGDKQFITIDGEKWQIWNELPKEEIDAGLVQEPAI